MEKHCHVFEEFIQFDNMYNGYLLARRHKRYKGEVLEYTANLEENLIDSINRLEWKVYDTGPLGEFYEYYPKPRLIFFLPFYDRVVNCAAYNVLFPIYEKSMYYHSYGSIPGKGTHAAVNQLQYWMKLVRHKPGKWILGKMDIKKFFFRIPTEVQLHELGKPLDDENMMWFLNKAVRAHGQPFGFAPDVTDVTTAERITGRGMQTGSLISQLTANVVLTPLDHYIKRELKVPYYIRFMDDMEFLVPSKSQAWDVIGAVGEFLEDELGLELNDKTAVMPYDAGVEFVGRRIWPDKIQLRRSTSLRMKQHLAFVMDHYATGELPLEYCHNVFTSYLGLMKGCDCDALRKKTVEDFVLIRKAEEEL